MPTFPKTVLMRTQPSQLFLFLSLAATLCAHGVAFGQSRPDSGESRSEEPGPGNSVNFAYRSTVSEVRLVFFAAENNHAVENLRKDDFAVVDDERVIRDFRSFTRSAATKLDLIVLIDSSDSVLPYFRQETEDVLQLISQSSMSPEDNLSVLSFSGVEVRSVCSGDCRRSFTFDQVASRPSGGSTPLFDAVEVAENFLTQRRQPDVWPAIILFSDGDDTVSKSSFHETSEKVVASGAPVYAIDVGRAGQPSSGTAILQRIAEDSGGRFFRNGEGAVEIFNAVMHDLHSARIVTYLAPVSGSDFHSIHILATRNLNLQFRCRQGYYRGSSSDH